MYPAGMMRCRECGFDMPNIYFVARARVCFDCIDPPSAELPQAISRRLSLADPFDGPTRRRDRGPNLTGGFRQ
jgi:hypothetical protein